MKNTTIANTQKNDSKLNTTTILVLIVAVLPLLLFSLTKMFPPAIDASSAKTAEVDEVKKTRVSAAERRAQRAEERKAKKAEKTATVQHGMAPDPGMAAFPPAPMEFGGFGPGMGFDNGMAMAPGGFGGGFGPGMGGPGMGFGAPNFGGPF